MSPGGSELHSNRWPPDHPDVVKLSVRLEHDAPYAVESMWARPMGDGLFVLDNVPFFAFGLSLGDKLYAHPASDHGLECSGVAQRGGHSTYRVVVAESASPERAAGYWRELQALGCDRELATPRLWALDVPPAADIVRVHGVLEMAEAGGVWTFEEAHVGHAVPRARGRRRRTRR